MSQPVVDTLQLSNALRKTGMEREQAEGVAGALGKELGAHVVVQGDLQSGFQQVRSELGSEIQQVRNELGSEIQQVRSELGLKIQAVDTKVDVLRAELTSKIDAVNWKLTFMIAGLGLLLSVLTVADGMGLLERAQPSPRPASETVFSPSPIAPHTHQAPVARGGNGPPPRNESRPAAVIGS